MATHRRVTESGLGDPQELPDKAGENGAINVPTTSTSKGSLIWFELISTHRSGLKERLGLLKIGASDAKITTNPIVKIERIMKNFFGSREIVLLHCSHDGRNLDPGLYFEYLSTVFLKIVEIIESKDAQLFYSDEDPTVILETCQRNLSFMAAVFPDVGLKFEQFAASNGGVVLGPLLPLEDAPPKPKTQPYITPVLNEVGPTAVRRRSSVPINSNQLYPAQALRDTVRPVAGLKRTPTLAGLGEFLNEIEGEPDNEVVPIDEVMDGTIPDADLPSGAELGGPVSIITSILPPPMEEAIAGHEAQKQLDALKRAADKEFEVLFVEAYEHYFEEYSEIHARAVKLMNSEEMDAITRQKNIEEGERLIESLHELTRDPEEIMRIAFGLALEKMDSEPESYPSFTQFYLERNQLDYRDHFAQHGKNIFAAKSRAFVDEYLPALLSKMIVPSGLRRDLDIHHRAILAAQDAGRDVPEDLSAINELILQIISKDRAVLLEEWPSKLATALTNKTFLTLGEALYRSKKASLVWALYFYQQGKRELADQVYLQILDAYLPICQQYQDELEPEVRGNMAQVAEEFARQMAEVKVDDVDPNTSEAPAGVGEVELSNGELDATDVSPGSKTSLEPELEIGEGELTSDEMAALGFSVVIEGTVSQDLKLPPLPEFIDPRTYINSDTDFTQLVMSILKAPNRVVKFRDYALSVSDLGDFIYAKDGWIFFQDKITETIERVDNFGHVEEKESDKVFGTWYFRPPNTLIPVRRPAAFTDTERKAGLKDDAPMTMTIEQVQAYYNKMPRDFIKAMYLKSFANQEGVADPFEGIAANELLFPEVVSEVLTSLPSAVELYGDMPEDNRPTMPAEGNRPTMPELNKKGSGWKYALAAVAMGAMGAIGYNAYKAAQQNDFVDGAVASSSVSNSKNAKPSESAKVADVKSAQPQQTATPVQPTAPTGPSTKIEGFPGRTYVSSAVLGSIPSEYTRKVVETGKYTVEGNGLGWGAQIATPFTRIASAQQLHQIRELQEKLNVGLYASSVKKYGNAAAVNAILMNPKDPEYKRVKFLVKKNVMGDPHNWDWQISTRHTGKKWDVKAAYEYYQTFEKEAMERNMDRHSPGVLHMGAWGGDVVEVYKDSKFMTYMIDVAEIVGIDLKPPTTGNVDPSLLQKDVPGAPGFIPELNRQPELSPNFQNKTGFLSPNVLQNFNFGFDSSFGKTGSRVDQPTFTMNFKPTAVEAQSASYNADLSGLNENVLAANMSEDLSIDVDLTELNTLAQEAAFDAEWDEIAQQHEAEKTVSPLIEKVAQIKNNRREALMKHGEVWVPSLADDLSGSAMMAFENGFMKECTSEYQQQRVRSILAKIRMGNLEEYEVLEDGSTYAKLNEKDMNALRTAMNEPTYEEELAALEDGWGFEEVESTPEHKMVVNVSRKVNLRVATVELSA